ncbi:sensor domain-containing diguanylate cyclase [Halomonas urumqiensis]|uniref:diguanylate cyclase n=1 Tax=Halomonas urumqiensis TaxID=1684789 RepID=A0A2N7UNU5_9GAMM|nr:sensor domain-containing diguanylate cyclase [Halomonas urumqiensis]PMR82091.1 histidine kinase [Halomonas urumqiensis]PTB02578.1 histidine kinase [Halomonas urumqiensis]GHE21058.1 hypothetical protein GCM10017767_15790 [Halomonas urumqiensis]
MPIGTRDTSTTALSSSIQPCGALLILDADVGRVLQASANLASIIGIPVEQALEEGPQAVFGHELARRLRRELTGRQRLSGALSVKRRVAGKLTSLQIDARRSGEQVIVEIEPLIRNGSRRLLATVNTWLARIAEAANPDDLLDALVSGVRDLTGHDRVLVCGFDADGHGTVLAEQRGAGVMSLLHMRFPASDFPPRTRELYDLVPLRNVPDISAPAVELMPARDPKAGAHPDLSSSLLRSISPGQRDYLERLEVAALLSIAMHADNGLWGLVLCHGMSPHPLSPAVRDAALSLTHMATQRLFLLKARSEARYLQRVQDSRQLLGSERGELVTPATLLQRHGESWLALFRAHGVALVMPGHEGAFGEVPTSQVLQALVARLEDTHHHPGPWSSHALGEAPQLAGLDLRHATGLMAVSFPLGETLRGWLLLFRAEQREVRLWAGLPGSMRSAGPPRALAPGDGSLLVKLFSEWRQEIQGQSLPWERVERLAAMDLAEDLAVIASAQEIQRLNERLRSEQQALAEANRRLEHLALFDPLTQVWNRYRIEQSMDIELSAAERYARPLALLLFDVDHFKEVNDTHGHELGDRVLSSLAREVEQVLRESDFLGRWGGEEFVVLATNSDLEAGLGLAERLRQRIAELEIGGLPEGVTISIGVAAWRPGDTRKRLLARADEAMYRAKAAGRDRVEAE